VVSLSVLNYVQPEPILIAEIFDQVSRLGSVHNAEPYAEPSPNTSSLAKVLEMPDSVFIDQVVSQMAVLGRVNHAVNPV
jgi:hypothetical protein